MLNKESKIFVAGHNGMVGSSICRELKKKGYKKIAVEKIENKGIGLAINERLQKASTKK